MARKLRFDEELAFLTALKKADLPPRDDANVIEQNPPDELKEPFEFGSRPPFWYPGSLNEPFGPE